jgi:hypothetical protein
MRTTILGGLLLAHLACSGGGIKRAGVDASPEAASPIDSPSSDSNRPTTEVGGPGIPPDTAAVIVPDTARDRTSDPSVTPADTAPDRPFDQAVASEDANRPFDQAVPSDRSPDHRDLRADLGAVPSQLPSGHYEILDDSPRTASPDAGQCVRGFIRAYAFEFSAGAQTVKVDPVSSIASVVMDGTLSDGSGPELRYDLKNPNGELAGDLLVWRQDDSWFAQVSVYGSRQYSGCVRGELVFKGPI